MPGVGGEGMCRLESVGYFLPPFFFFFFFFFPCFFLPDFAPP